jgi:AraC-like DNA-binding protein
MQLTPAGTKSQQFTIAQIDTIFDFHKPGPPLSNFVENLWLFEGSGAGSAPDRILPTGTLELAINLRKNELKFHDVDHPENASRFSGAVLSGAHGHGFAPGDTEEVVIIGVHSKPGGAYPFLGQPAGELADIHVDLESLWGTAAVILRERLCEAKTSAERFCLLEDALLKRLCRGVEQHYAVQAALEMFGTNQGGPRVREAAEHVGLSQRRFIQAFKAEVGLTPKLFTRIQRFQRTRAFVHKDPSPDWPIAALDLGYFDQSHLIREFVEFSGLRPTDYLNRLKNFF